VRQGVDVRLVALPDQLGPEVMGVWSAIVVGLPGVEGEHSSAIQTGEESDGGPGEEAGGDQEESLRNPEPRC
jgi:hypothetical protein